MPRVWFRPLSLVAFCLCLGSALSCKLFVEPTRPLQAPPPPNIKPTGIDYVDSDGFDALLESSLTNADPVILIQTQYQRPEWTGRLNAWIAAWNMGGKVEAISERRKVRMQSPLIPSVTVDKDSIREFRILVEGFMDRVDVLATRSTAWWAEERVRRHRVDLLKPYNLRFHQDESGTIQIIFFNGRYSQQYVEFMKTVVSRGEADETTWERNFSCSRCPAGLAQAGP